MGERLKDFEEVPASLVESKNFENRNNGKKTKFSTV